MINIGDKIEKKIISNIRNFTWTDIGNNLKHEAGFKIRKNTWSSVMAKTRHILWTDFITNYNTPLSQNAKSYITNQINEQVKFPPFGKKLLYMFK
jgi:hypothetical protein